MSENGDVSGEERTEGSSGYLNSFMQFLDNPDDPPESKEKPSGNKKGAKRKKSVDVDELEEQSPPTRRRSARTAAKEQTKAVSYRDEEDLADSDGDPAWSPVASDDEDKKPAKGKRGRPGPPAKRKSTAKATPQKQPSTPAAKEKPEEEPKKEKLSDIKKNGTKTTTGGGGDAAEQKSQKPYVPVSRPHPGRQPARDPLPELAPEEIERLERQFKSGDFVILKVDLEEQDIPTIWRIDGKSLLQKFVPFQKDGQLLYKGISTYAGWAMHDRHKYQNAKITFVLQSRSETVVKFIKDEKDLKPKPSKPIIDPQFKHLQEPYEVFVQTLISQVLDPTFLTEIFQEQDDYFVTNVKSISDATQGRLDQLKGLLEWKDELWTSLGIWPDSNGMMESGSDKCEACLESTANHSLKLIGQPLHPVYLKNVDVPPNSVKEFRVCGDCCKLAQLIQKAKNYQQRVYVLCTTRVTQEKIKNPPSKDTTQILKDLLADENWLGELFSGANEMWLALDAEIKKRENATETAEKTNNDSS